MRTLPRSVRHEKDIEKEKVITCRKPRARIFEEKLQGAKREESGEGRKRRIFGGVGGCLGRWWHSISNHNHNIKRLRIG